MEVLVTEVLSAMKTPSSTLGYCRMSCCRLCRRPTRRRRIGARWHNLRLLDKLAMDLRARTNTFSIA